VAGAIDLLVVPGALSRSDPTSSFARHRGSDRLWTRCRVSQPVPAAALGAARACVAARFARYQFSDAVRAPGRDKSEILRLTAPSSRVNCRNSAQLSCCSQASATILPSLPAPTAIGLENPLDRFTVQEGFPFLQPGVTPVAAPAVLSQRFPALHWRSLAQHYSSHRIEMQIAVHLQQNIFRPR
jgi:hypothetical protein